MQAAAIRSVAPLGLGRCGRVGGDLAHRVLVGHPGRLAVVALPVVVHERGHDAFLVGGEGGYVHAGRHDGKERQRRLALGAVDRRRRHRQGGMVVDALLQPAAHHGELGGALALDAERARDARVHAGLAREGREHRAQVGEEHGAHGDDRGQARERRGHAPPAVRHRAREPAAREQPAGDQQHRERREADRDLGSGAVDVELDHGILHLPHHHDRKRRDGEAHQHAHRPGAVPLLALLEPDLEEDQGEREAGDEPPPMLDRLGLVDRERAAHLVEQAHAEGELQPQVQRREHDHQPQVVVAKTVGAVAGERVVLAQQRGGIRRDGGRLGGAARGAPQPAAQQHGHGRQPADRGRQARGREDPRQHQADAQPEVPANRRCSQVRPCSRPVLFVMGPRRRFCPRKPLGGNCYR